MKNIYKLLILLFIFVIAESEIPLEEKTLRLTFDKDKEGNLQANITDTSGKKQPLTLGTFVALSTKLLLGNKIENCKSKKSKSLKLHLEREQSGRLFSFFYNAKGEKLLFEFNNFLVSLPDFLDCEGSPANQSEPPNGKKFLEAEIFYEIENGDLQVYIKHIDGRKEHFCIGTLLTAAAELLPNCTLGTEKERAIDILFINPGVGLRAIQIDAYGLIEQLTLDNLIKAAADTLQVCEKDKEIPRTFIKIPKNLSVEIRFKKDSNNTLKSYLVNSEGKILELSLGTLLSSLALLKKCEKTNVDILYLDISFKKTSNGLKPIVTDSNGIRKELTFLEDLADIAISLCAGE